MFRQKTSLNICKFLIIGLMFFTAPLARAQGDHDGPYPFNMDGKVYISLSKSLPISIHILAIKAISEVEDRTTLYDVEGLVKFVVYPDMTEGEYEITEIRYSRPSEADDAKEVDQRHYLTVIARSASGDILILDLYSSNDDQKWYLGRVNFVGTRKAHSKIFGKYIGRGLPVRFESIEKP